MFSHPRASSLLIGFIGALAAIVGFLTSVHLWSDHVALHVMLDFLNQHGEKIRMLP